MRETEKRNNKKNEKTLRVSCTVVIFPHFGSYTLVRAGITIRYTHSYRISKQRESESGGGGLKWNGTVAERESSKLKWKTEAKKESKITKRNSEMCMCVSFLPSLPSLRFSGGGFLTTNNCTMCTRSTLATQLKQNKCCASVYSKPENSLRIECLWKFGSFAFASDGQTTVDDWWVMMTMDG